jgi:hypothetical protein
MLADIEAFEKKIKPYKESGAKQMTEAELQKAENNLKKW